MEIALVDSSDPVLRQVCVDVEDIRNEVRPALAGMKRIIEGKGGLGLSAPQVGIRLRFFISKIKGLGVAVNPAYVPLAASVLVKKEEGCLSWPGKTVAKLRHSDISVSYGNKYGSQRSAILRDRDARIFQHECDHLDGICLF